MESDAQAGSSGNRAMRRRFFDVSQLVAKLQLDLCASGRGSQRKPAEGDSRTTARLVHALDLGAGNRRRSGLDFMRTKYEHTLSSLKFGNVAMSAITRVKQQLELDRLEVAIDRAVAVCGGDMRSTIRSLIIANEFLEHEVKELFVAVSRGYARNRQRAAPDPLPRDRKDWYD
jgi:hypothetical protein